MNSEHAKIRIATIPHFCFALIAILLAYTTAHALLLHYTNNAPKASLIAICIVFSLSVLITFLLGGRSGKASRSSQTSDLPFLICLLTSGLAFTMVMAPGTVPDEEYHYISSYCYTNGFDAAKMSGDDGKEYLHVQARKTDSDFFYQSVSQKELNRDKYSINETQLSSSADSAPAVMITDHTSANNVTANPITVRFASSAGIALGKLLGINGELTFYLGRLLNFIFFSVLIYAAVRITPVGKAVFETVALLPMTLHLASSFSYDAPLMGYAFLFTALSLKLIKGKGRIGTPDLVLNGILAFCLGTCKGVYALLLVLVFFIPTSRFTSKRAALFYRIVVVALPVFAFTLLMLETLLNMLGLANIDQTASSSITSDSGSQSMGIMDLVAHPLTAALILVKTLHSQLAFYVDSFLGGSLGWFQTNLKAPAFFTAVYAVLLYLGSVYGIKDEDCFTGKPKVAAVAVLIIGFLGILYSMMTGWYINDYIILGVQGRYFIPFAPFGIILIRSGILRFKKEVSLESIITAEQTLNGIYLVFILTNVLLAS